MYCSKSSLTLNASVYLDGLDKLRWLNERLNNRELLRSIPGLATQLHYLCAYFGAKWFYCYPHAIHNSNIPQESEGH